MQLQSKARKPLNVIAERLRIEQRIEVKSCGWTSHLQQWCNFHDVDCSLVFNAPQLYFTTTTLNTINQTLNQLKQAPLSASFSENDRFFQAKHGLGEDKQQGIKPSENRVLIYHFCTASPLPTQQQQDCIIIDIDWRTLDLSAFKQLVVVENLDCFYQLYQQFKLPKLADSLIIYRGHNHYSKSVAALKATFNRQNKPRIYFGDFDSKGLNIAITEQYSHLLLPSLAFMQQHANKTHHAPEQQSFFPKVQQFWQSLSDKHPSKTMLAIHNQQRSLKQQWFAEADSFELYSLEN
jgi:hypothetical protein